MKFSDLPREEKELHINNYFNSVSKDEFSFISSNVREIRSIAVSVLKILYKYRDKNLTFYDYYNCPRMDYYSKVKLVNDFYKSIGIRIDIDELVNNGDIHLCNNDDTISDEDTSILLVNHVRGENSSTNAFLSNSGKSVEAIIYAHEIAHYIDEHYPKEDFGRRLLSETVAISSEMLFLDFVKDNSLFDCEVHAKLRAKDFTVSTFEAIEWCNYIESFALHGSYNIDSFNEVHKGDYESSLNFFNTLYNSNYSVVDCINHCFAMFFAPYIVYQYHINKEFSKSYKEIFKTSNIDDFMKAMGINLSIVDSDSFCIFLDNYLYRNINSNRLKRHI